MTLRCVDMSVDGEVLTDLRRLHRQWSERCNIGALREGTAALVIQGPPGCGCTSALRAVVDAQHRDMPTRPLTPASWAAAMAADEPAVMLTADYYSIVALIPSPCTSGHYGGVVDTSAFVIVVVDDIISVRALLVANNAVANLDALLAELAARGGVLLTTASTHDGENCVVPLFIDSLFAATLTYKLHATLPAGATRRMLRELDAESEGLHVRAPLTKRMLECAVQVHNVGAVGLSASVDVVSRCQSHRDGKELARRLPTDQGATRLFGLEELGRRLEMLCRIHCSRLSGGSIDDNALVEHVAAGRVARVCAATTGVLLHGPSGCGKSALLRQLAARLPQTPFFYVLGSHMYAKYVGESEERLRRVFATARQHQPCILVIEEIDILAPSRQSAAASGGDEGLSSTTGLDVTRRMLAALLCEMDGVSSNEGVLVIATTNQFRSVDQALLRQGRLETPLYVPPLSSRSIYDMCLSSLEALVIDESVRVVLATMASDQCGGCSASALRLLLRYAVEHMAGDNGTCELTPELWSSCIRDCSKHLHPQIGSDALH